MSDPDDITVTRMKQTNVVKVEQNGFRSYLSREDVTFYLYAIARPTSPGFVRHEGLWLNREQLLTIEAALAPRAVAS